jgi:hypothetical protein
MDKLSIRTLCPLINIELCLIENELQPDLILRRVRKISEGSCIYPTGQLLVRNYHK